MAWCPTLANPKKPSRHGAFSCTDPRAAFRVAFGLDSEERCMGANADVIRQAWEAFGQQDLDGATADMDGDAEVIVPESLPWGGTYRGPDGFKEMVGQFLSQFEDFRPDIEGRFRGRERPGVPLDTWGRSKAGKEMSSRALWLYRLRDGKVVRAEIFPDTADTLEAVS